jgi:hypothetical protein
VTEEDDASLVRRLRAADAVLNERPSPRVRKAVMRLAAESARQAAGQPASNAVPARPGARWLLLHWRWSASVAASVLVGAVAVGLISEIQRTAVPPGEGPAISAQSEAKPRYESAVPQSGVPAAPAASGSLATRREVPLPARPSSAKTIISPSESSGAPSAAPPSAPAAARTADRAAAQAISAQQTPQQWLDRIMVLRREGRQEEADRELSRLRERFPEVIVPPAALRPRN